MKCAYQKNQNSCEIYPYNIKYSSSYMNVPEFLSSREIYPYDIKYSSSYMNVPEFLSSREIYPYGIKYSSSYMNVPKFLSSREIYPYHTKIFQLERTKISEFSWNLSIHQNIPAHVSLMHRKIQWQRWNFITKCHILILETWGIIIWAKICLFDWIVSCIFGQTHLGNLTYLSDCLQLDLYTKEIIQPENN